MKLLRKSKEVSLRLEVGDVCLLQGKAGVAESVCPETSLPQGDFFNVPEGRVQRGPSLALLGGLLMGSGQWVQTETGNALGTSGNVFYTALLPLVQVALGGLWNLSTLEFCKSILDRVTGRFLEVAQHGQWS